MWREISGYKFRYRVSDEGEVERLFGGEWKGIYQFVARGQSHVKLRRNDGTRYSVQVSRLVADAFLGGTPKGKQRRHKNGVKLDNSAKNIVFLSASEGARRRRVTTRKPVFKIDRTGEVIEVYGSVSDAAKKNYITINSVTNRCKGKILMPFRLTGYSFRWAD